MLKERGEIVHQKKFHIDDYPLCFRFTTPPCNLPITQQCTWNHHKRGLGNGFLGFVGQPSSYLSCIEMHLSHSKLYGVICEHWATFPISASSLLATDSLQEMIISTELPLVQEIGATLREWVQIWQNLYVVRDYTTPVSSAHSPGHLSALEHIFLSQSCICQFVPPEGKQFLSFFFSNFIFHFSYYKNRRT